MTIAETINRRLEALVSLPGDSPELLGQKKTYLAGLSALFGMVVVLTLTTWALDMPVLTRYGLFLLAFFAPQIALFIWLRRGLPWFILISNTYNILLAFVFMLLLGGIPYCGGLVFVGLACVVYTMIFPSTRIFWWCFGMYVATLVLAFVLHPYLKPAPEMTGWKNVLFFVLNALWLSANMVVLLLYVYQKRVELADLKAQKLLEMDAVKTRLFANISHEFRTPLTLIRGAADMIPSTPSNRLQERTDTIRRNTNRLLMLVDQMLHLARLEAGSVTVRPVQSDVVAFLKMLFHSFSGLAEYRKIRMHFLPAAPSFVMDFDPDILEQIVSNLLSNAIKYTHAGGDVYLEFYANAGQAVLRVKDTGIGIPADQLENIFDRFYRVEHTSKHYEEGSGIGLTLVREYILLLGGTVEVHSRPSEGSEFTVTLPVTRLAAAPQTEPGVSEKTAPDPQEIDLFPATGADDASMPLLLVLEDNQELAHYLTQVLRPSFRIRTASNGEEGIHLALELVPDLILSDVMMPVKDGFEVCRMLKKDFRTSHIPIVLLSARADAASRIAGLEQGADAYLTKPFNKRELLVCLRNLFVQREKLRIRYASTHGEGEGEAAESLDARFLREARSILEKRYSDETFGIEALYTALGVSRVQLHRKLIALTGLSASHFIRSFRLEKAQNLLRTTRKPVSEIAYETGFSDANYFSRIFSQEYGMPPSDIRNGQPGEA